MKLPIVKKNNSNNVFSTDILSSFWDPFDPVRWISPSASTSSALSYGTYFDYQYEGEDLILSCDLPGVKLEDIQLEMEGNQLRVHASRNRQKTYDCTQSVILPKEYDSETAEATLEYGVLSIRFKKLASVKPKRIEIKEKR